MGFHQANPAAEVTERDQLLAENILEVLLDWGECPLADEVVDPESNNSNAKSVERRECSRADVDGNGVVGLPDLLRVLDAYSFYCDRLNGG